MTAAVAARGLILSSHTGPSRSRFTRAVRQTGQNTPEKRTVRVKRDPDGHDQCDPRPELSVTSSRPVLMGVVGLMGVMDPR
jgi:hypothetical protein